MPRVCVIGSANLDITMALPRLPRAGETVVGGTLLVNRGGKGANQAVAARRLGAEVRMIGCVGGDGGGAQIREGLAQLGIGVEGLMTVPEAATGTALILVDPDGQNEIGVALGANDRLTVDMASAHEASVAWAEVLLCQLETPLPVVRWGLESAKRHGVTTILNPAPVQPLTDDLLALADFLTPNEVEAGALSGVEARDVESAREAAERLLGRGAHRVVITLGGQGALACDDIAPRSPAPGAALRTRCPTAPRSSGFCSPCGAPERGAARVCRLLESVEVGDQAGDVNEGLGVPLLDQHGDGVGRQDRFPAYGALARGGCRGLSLRSRYRFMLQDGAFR